MWNKVRSISENVSRREKRGIRFPEDNDDEANRKVNNRVKLAWLAPSYRKKRYSLHQSIWKHVKLYLNNSSLAGYKYMVDSRRTLFERLMWVVLHTIMMFILCLIVWDVLQDYRHKPVVTVVDSYNYPSNLLDLPGVSVCSINRISRKAVEGLAERIKQSNVTDQTTDEIVELLYDLGYLYESSAEVTNQTRGIEVDDLLKKFFGDGLDFAQLMKELTPQCADIMLRCRFHSAERDCSELFSFRKTQDGFCCTFNYARGTVDTAGPMIENHTGKVYQIEKLGQINGLTFLMEPFLNDYFFPILPISGWKITIFNPSDYPDNTSGGVSDALISPGTENFLQLDAMTFYSEKAVRSFNIEDRKCIFNDEVEALYDGYTYSDCIVDCKINDIYETCGCRPFYFPRRTTYRRFCNTSDVECLFKFKSKWWSVLPHDIKPGSEESQIFNDLSNESSSLRCKSCYPSCEDVHYYLQTSNVKLQKKEQMAFLKDIKIADQSLVHVYFAKYGIVRLKQDVAYYWYELLSNIGGICGVFIGFSIISVVELLYFIVLSISKLWKRNDDTKRPKSIDEDAEFEQARKLRTLYWSELAPQRRN